LRVLLVQPSVVRGRKTVMPGGLSGGDGSPNMQAV